MSKKVNPRLPNPSRREFLFNSSLALIGLAGAGFPGICRAGGGQVLHIRNYMDVSSLDPVSTVSTAEGLIRRCDFSEPSAVQAGQRLGYSARRRRIR